MIILKTRLRVKVTQIWHQISPSKDAFLHQIKDSYLKEHRRYPPDLMLILESRSWS